MRCGILIFVLFITNNAFSQDDMKKYCEVIRYLKSQKTERVDSINVSPVIRYISSSSFLYQLDSLANSTINIDIKRDAISKFTYFKPYFNTHLDSCYRRNTAINNYLLFSKPIGNILLVEIREGNYSTDNYNVPYFGSAIKYLFLFDKENSIVRVLKDTITYN